MICCPDDWRLCNHNNHNPKCYSALYTPIKTDSRLPVDTLRKNLKLEKFNKLCIAINTGTNVDLRQLEIYTRGFS